MLGVTDKLPQFMDATIYNSYKFNIKPDRVNIHYVNKAIFDLGIVEVETMYGNLVRVYSYERVLCDFIAHKEQMDTEIYVKLVRFYSQYEKKDIHRLYEIAQKMHITKAVKEIMEVTYG